MVMGRPQEYDRKDWADKLVAWAKKEDSLNLNGFTSETGLIPCYITRFAKDDEYFCYAYNYAKARIAHRREQALKEDRLHVKAYDLNARVYDHYIKEERREEMKYEHDLKTEQSAQMDGKLSAVLDKLDSLTSEKDFDRAP